MGVNAPILGAVLQVGLQERTVSLVQFARLKDHFGQGMLVGVQKALGKAGRTGGGLGVLDGQAVKGRGNGLRGPDVHLHAGLALQVLQDVFLLAAHLGHFLLALGPVKVDALQGYVNKNRQHLCFQVEDGLNLLLAHEHLQVVPQLQGERRVLLGILTHVHGRQLPQLLLGVHAKIRGGFF